VTPAEFYHQRAAECFELAHRIVDPHERVVMKKLAKFWLRALNRVNEPGKK
jgi:hypothetical protein